MAKCVLLRLTVVVTVAILTAAEAKAEEEIGASDSDNPMVRNSREDEEVPILAKTQAQVAGSGDVLVRLHAATDSGGGDAGGSNGITSSAGVVLPEVLAMHGKLNGEIDRLTALIDSLGADFARIGTEGGDSLLDAPIHVAKEIVNRFIDAVKKDAVGGHAREHVAVPNTAAVGAVASLLTSSEKWCKWPPIPPHSRQANGLSFKNLNETAEWRCQIGFSLFDGAGDTCTDETNNAGFECFHTTCLADRTMSVHEGCICRCEAEEECSEPKDPNEYEDATEKLKSTQNPPFWMSDDQKEDFDAPEALSDAIALSAGTKCNCGNVTLGYVHECPSIGEDDNGIDVDDDPSQPEMDNANADDGTADDATADD